MNSSRSQNGKQSPSFDRALKELIRKDSNSDMSSTLKKKVVSPITTQPSKLIETNEQTESPAKGPAQDDTPDSPSIAPKKTKERTSSREESHSIATPNQKDEKDQVEHHDNEVTEEGEFSPLEDNEEEEDLIDDIKEQQNSTTAQHRDEPSPSREQERKGNELLVDSATTNTSNTNVLETVQPSIVIVSPSPIMQTITSPSSTPSNRLTLDVGGKRFSTSITTLKSQPESLFAELARGDVSETTWYEKDGEGIYFIDRNGKLFGKILDWVRTKNPITVENAVAKKDLLKEADFYKIKGMEVECLLDDEVPPISSRAKVKKQISFADSSTEETEEKRLAEERERVERENERIERERRRMERRESRRLVRQQSLLQQREEGIKLISEIQEIITELEPILAAYENDEIENGGAAEAVPPPQVNNGEKKKSSKKEKKEKSKSKKTMTKSGSSKSNGVSESALTPFRNLLILLKSENLHLETVQKTMECMSTLPSQLSQLEILLFKLQSRLPHSLTLTYFNAQVTHFKSIVETELPILEKLSLHKVERLQIKSMKHLNTLREPMIQLTSLLRRWPELAKLNWHKAQKEAGSLLEWLEDEEKQRRQKIKWEEMHLSKLKNHSSSNSTANSSYSNYGSAVAANGNGTAATTISILPNSTSMSSINSQLSSGSKDSTAPTPIFPKAQRNFFSKLPLKEENQLLDLLEKEHYYLLYQSINSQINKIENLQDTLFQTLLNTEEAQYVFQKKHHLLYVQDQINIWISKMEEMLMIQNELDVQEAQQKIIENVANQSIMPLK